MNIIRRLIIVYSILLFCFGQMAGANDLDFNKVRSVIHKHIPEVRVLHSKKKSHKLPKFRSCLNNGESIWKPSKVKKYDYIDGAWQLVHDVELIYNDKGQISTVDYLNDNVRVSIEYNKNDLVSKEIYEDLIHGIYVEKERITYTYDSILTNYVVLVEDSIKEDSDWELFRIEKREISRNAQGNIIEIKGFCDWNFGQKVLVSYGNDNKACMIDILDDEYGNGYYLPYLRYTDIEWYETNGQITSLEPLIPETFMGENRIKYAKLTGFDSVGGGGSLSLDLNVYYKDNNDGFNYVMSYLDVMTTRYEYTVLDNNGSYEVVESQEYIDEDTGLPYTYLSTEKKIIGDDSNIICFVERDYENSDLYYYYEGRGIFTYDEQFGYPIEYIYQERNGENDEWKDSNKTIYSDYVEIGSGVTDISTPEDSPEEYYTIGGLKVNASNLKPGMYIKRKGQKTEKLLIK